MKTRLAFATVTVVCLLGRAQLSADEITDWNNILFDSVRTNSMSPLPARRISAAMNTAMYDAVNSIALGTRQKQTHFGTGRIGAARWHGELHG